MIINTNIWIIFVHTISQSTCFIKRYIGTFENYRAKFVSYSRDDVASRKTSRDNEHNSMSPACASLINYSSWVIEAFAPTPPAPSFVADDEGPYYAKPAPRILASLFTLAYIYIYVYLYIGTRARARELRDCIIAKSLIEQQVSNAAESWEGTAASVHPSRCSPTIKNTRDRYMKPIKEIRIKSH